MKRAAVWVCPDCGTKLEGVAVHECPHGRLCLPRLLGGPPSWSRDECDVCAKSGVLLLDFCGPERVLPDGTTRLTAQFSVWAQRRAREEREAAERSDRKNAHAKAPEETEEQKRTRAEERARARAEARDLARTEAAKILAVLRSPSKVSLK